MRALALVVFLVFGGCGPKKTVTVDGETHTIIGPPALSFKRMDCPVSADAVPYELPIEPFEIEVKIGANSMTINVTGDGEIFSLFAKKEVGVGQVFSDGTLKLFKGPQKKGLQKVISLHSTGEITGDADSPACGLIRTDEENNIVSKVTTTHRGSSTMVIAPDMTFKVLEIPMTGVIKGPPKVRKVAAFIMSVGMFDGDSEH